MVPGNGQSAARSEIRAIEYVHVIANLAKGPFGEALVDLVYGALKVTDRTLSDNALSIQREK